MFKSVNVYESNTILPQKSSLKERNYNAKCNLLIQHLIVEKIKYI